MTPPQRPRRLRQTDALRTQVRETQLNAAQLVYPLFVTEAPAGNQPIPSMPGCAQHSIPSLVEEVRGARDDGVTAVILFGIPKTKDATGSSGRDPGGVVPRAIRAVKEAAPEMLVWADVCLCEYTSHGHCGILTEHPVHGVSVDNDATLPLLAEAALAYATAGADVIAPSDMMDGRVRAIRQALDQGGYQDTIICSYAVKYASAFYGPFRDAAESAPAQGDRRSYQMDPANAREALREAALDLEEGADMVMVKPALPYLDIVRRLRRRCAVPIAAYNVSGEYAMLEAAAERGWIDGEAAMWESLTAIRRAGADLILTYFARRAARALTR